MNLSLANSIARLVLRYLVALLFAAVVGAASGYCVERLTSEPVWTTVELGAVVLSIGFWVVSFLPAFPWARTLILRANLRLLAMALYAIGAGVVFGALSADYHRIFTWQTYAPDVFPVLVLGSQRITQWMSTVWSFVERRSAAPRGG